MSEGVIDRLMGGHGDGEDQHACYGCRTNQDGPLYMLDIRQRGGDRVCLSYSYFESGELNLSGTITLNFSTHKVDIEGQRLETLYEALSKHDVVWVAAVGEYGDVGDGEPLVETIKLTPKVTCPPKSGPS